MKNSINQQSGFTLIELMMCISVAMTLITVAIPKYKDYSIKAKYVSAITQIGANKNGIIDRAIQNGFSFSNLPEEQLDHIDMQKHFSLRDTANGKYTSHIGGQKESDYDYMLYQFVDKEAMRAPEIAPEMVAMAVVIEASGAISYHCHYYHSDYLWDYEGGEEYVDFSCDDYDIRPSAEVTSTSDSTTEGSFDSGSSGTDHNHGNGPCTHGKLVNNGHGNNVDGVDSSNPGNSKKEDASCTGKKCVDDEKRG